MMRTVVAHPDPDRRAAAAELIRSGAPKLEPNLSAPALVRDPDGEPLMAVLRAPADTLASLRWAMTVYPRDSVVRGHGSRSGARTFGYGARQVVMQRNCCREVNGAQEHPTAHAAILAGADTLAGMLGEVLPDIAQRDHALAKAEVLPEWRIRNSQWTSGVVNWTAPLPYHYDRNNLEPIWSAMVVARRGIRGGHLHVPELDVVLECRDGDVVLFPGWRFVHAVTPMVKVTKDAYRFSAVYYAVSRMRACLPWEEEVAHGRAERTEREGDLRPAEERIPPRPDNESRRGPIPMEWRRRARTPS